MLRPSRLALSVFRYAAPRLGLLLCISSAAAQTSLYAPVGVVSEPIGTKSSAQTTTVTVTTAGTLNGINLLTEGINNKDFQLTTYSCNPGTGLTVGKTCTIGYTFQPQTAGLRRGGVTLTDSTGYVLGQTYLAGYGTGPLATAFATSSGLATFQVAIPVSNAVGQMALDAAGNIYYSTWAGPNGSGEPHINKATLNSNGTYTSAVLATGTDNGLITGLAVDGLGNIYFTDFVSVPQAPNNCFIRELVPQGSGYNLQLALSLTSNVCPDVLAVDGAGTIYIHDAANFSLGRFKLSGGTYTYSQIASNINSAADLWVDASLNFYVAAGDSAYGSALFLVYLYNPSSDSYTYRLTPGPGQNYGYEQGVTVDATGTFWLSDIGASSSSNPPSAIFRYVPVSGQYSYTGTQFTNGVAPFIGPIRFDSAGNLFFEDLATGSNNSLGIYKASASSAGLTFASTTSGSVSAAQSVVVTNLGTNSSVLSAESSGIGYQGEFSKKSGSVAADGYNDCSTAFSLAAAGSCNISSVFSPTSSASGLQTGYLDIFSNSDNSSSSEMVIPLQGTANHPLPTVTGISPASGDSAGGTSVTITGTYLGDATGVAFNSTAAQSVSPVSATQVMAIAPAGTANSSATITVTNPGGTGTSAANAWHWNAAPSGTASTLALSTSSIAQSATTTVTATIFSGGSPLSNEVVTFSSSNGSVAASPGQAITNSSGVATATITGLHPGATTINASVDSITLSAAPVLTVTPPVVAVGSTLSGQIANVTITKAGTLAGTFLLNKGKNSADWELSGYSCNPGAPLTVGTLCIVSYVFSPVEPGLRQGAIVLEDSSGNVLGETFLSGIGLGTQGLFSAGNGPNIVATAPNNDAVTSVAIDDSGNLYYADQTAETVSKVTSSGTKTVLASGINTVTGVAIDGAGNVFYGAYGANEVYELINGAGSPVAIASVTSPDIGMATDGFGNIYVSSPQEVIKIDATTHATTKVGVASGYVPGVAVDASGNIYYTDTSNNLIYRTPAGSTTGSVIVSSGLSGPRGITVDPAGNLYVASQGAGTLTRLTAGTYASTVIASGYSVNSIVLDQYGNLFSAIGTSGVLEVARTTSPHFIWSNVPELSTTAIDTLAFENDGNAPMTFSSYTVTSPFQIATTSNACATGAFAIAATCEIAADFAPKSEGSFSGYATLTEASGTTHQVALSGVAVYADPTVTGISPASGTAAGGTLVTITGTNFTTDVSAIRFGNTYTSNFTLVSQTQITVTAPAGTGVVDVIVANPRYSSATSSADKFTYLTTQTITFPQPATPVIAGTQATLTATASSGLAVTYSVTGPATLSGSAISYTGVGTVVITASQAGNSSYAPATSVQCTVTVQNSQTITFPQPTTPKLVGAQATLTATASSGLAVSYAITSGYATLSGSVVTFTGSGPVVITATQVGNATYAAATPVSDTVTVTAVAVASVAPSTPVGSTSAVQTATILFTATGTMGGMYTSSQGNDADFEFRPVSPSTCTGGQYYQQGQTCTIGYTFTPAAPGERLGGVTVVDNSGQEVPLGVAYISGVGLAPQGLFTNGTPSILASNVDSLGALAVDNNGSVYYTDANTINAITSQYTYTIANQGSPLALVIDGAGNLLYGASGGVAELSGATGAYGGTASTVATLEFGTDLNIEMDGAGNVYTTSNGDIYKISASTYAVTKLYAGDGTRFEGMGIDAAGNLYPVSHLGNTLYELPVGATTLTTLVSGGALNHPQAVVVDAGGNIYATNSTGFGSCNVLRYSAGTYALTTLGTGCGPLAIDRNGTLYTGSQDGKSLLSYVRTAAPAVSFPSTPVGSISAPTLVGFENDGNMPLAVSAFAATTNFGVTGAGNTCGTGSLAANGTCNFSVVFAPTATGALTGTATLTGNTLNASNKVQSIALSGTATQGTQTITFPQPATPALGGTQSALTATASSGLTVTYTVSGPATLNGSVISYTGAGSVVITANQAGNSNYAAATAVQRTVTTIQTTQTITFPPPPNDVANGYATLNATASSGLAVTYTVANGPAIISGSTITYTGAGTVQIAANQAGNATYAAATTITNVVTVSSNYVWLVNNNGTLSRLSNVASAIGTLGTAGGTSSLGGVAVDNTGNVWSVSSANSSLISTTSAAATPVTHSSSTLNGPSAVAVDGAGYLWVANSNNGSITVFDNSGTAQTSTAYSATASKAASSIQGTPSSISIDETGGVWISNKTGNSVTHVFGAATPVVTPLSTAVTNSTLGSKP